MNTNIILTADSYKFSHGQQLPPNTTHISSYVEARPGSDYEDIVFFGLQAYLKEYLSKPITQADIDEAESIITAHGEPFNRTGWQHILDKHQGRLPIRIHAVKEGTVYKAGTPLVTVENTDANVPWLTSFLETGLLRAVWYPSTVATTSFRIKRIINDYLSETGDQAGLPFKLHDFGARGVSSEESAKLGGMAHLVNFMGTDTVAALVGARRYYGADMAGFSIPAAEHSTITSWGQQNEARAYENMVEQFGGAGKIYAVVSDSYDIYNAVTNIWGKELKEKVLAKGGTLVVRPDSGDPVVVVLKVVEALGEAFGYTVNDKGFKVLNPAVRVIQGDGVNEMSIRAILMNLRGHGWSADNVAFGMGGALLQGINRDTCRWAMKCSAMKVDGTWRDVFKNPVTDTGKVSKKGRQITPEMRTVWEDGTLLVDDSLVLIRARATEAL